MAEITKKPTAVLRRLGPGLITAAVVLGPGTIISASRAGAEHAYDLVWVIIIAAIFMATYTSMGARVGCALDKTPLEFVADKWGRPFAFIIGLSGFLVATGFQFGNNLGVTVAMEDFIPVAPWIWPVFFTILALVFLFAARDIYKWLERIIIVLVFLMLGAFIINLVRSGVDVPKLAGGLVPRRFEENQNIIGRAMVATNFSIVAAFYQAYLVRAKGWDKSTVGYAIRDAWIGIALLGSIGLIILISAAQSLYGTGSSFEDLGQLARQFRETLGPSGHIIFAVGVGAASFSSFLANALIGGVLLADGLGMGHTINSRAARVCTSIAMIIGCVVAVLVIGWGAGNTTSILVGQAATLIAAPLSAILLLGLAASKATAGNLRNNIAVNIIGVIGLVIILWLMAGTVMSIANRF